MRLSSTTMQARNMLFAGRRLVRLGFAYLYLAFLQWLFVKATFVDISLINFFSDSHSLAVSSNDSNSINNLPAAAAPDDPTPPRPIENPAPLPLDVVDQFRLLNQETELELFARIRLLENRLIEGLPPQLNPGEYEALVRGFLDDTLTIEHYCEVVNNELFDLTVLELKANLFEQLVDLLLSERTERLTQILSESPFPERAIRPEALEFINDFMTRFNLHEPRSTFDKGLVESMLRYWIQDAQQNGHLSDVYKEFVRHFLGK